MLYEIYKSLPRIMEYKVSIKQFREKGIKPKLGKKVLFISFTDPGIMYVKIKKIRKRSVIVSTC